MDSGDLFYVLFQPMFSLAVYFVLSSCFEKKRKIAYTFTIFALHSLALNLLYLSHTPEPIFFLANVVFLMLLSAYYTKSIMEMISATIITLAFLLPFDMLFTFGIGNPYHNAPLLVNYYVAGANLFQHRLVLVLFAYLVPKFKKARALSMPYYYYLAYLTAFFCIIDFYTNFFMTIYQPDVTEFEELTRLYLTTLFFGLLLLLDTLATQFVVSHSQNKLKREQEIAFANQKELIEQSMLTIATLKHDMKNQILTLMALQKEGKTEEIAHYTQHILDEIEGDDTCAQTNHFVVDSIINYKLRDHSNTDLNIILNLTLPPELPLLAYDLTIILGNLLDNALTALDQVQGERTLSITITSRFDNLMILMDNTFNGTLKIEDGNLRTTKGFSTGHGLGVPSVKQTVEKYHGEFHYEYGSQNFSVTVLIPINE